uniref:ABC transmembrane type-1 domain-containing protein n=1 Tax=Sinocyclocheilus grahami TaxID=75366 RepID=A0A672MMM4_SINGR
MVALYLISQLTGGLLGAVMANVSKIHAVLKHSIQRIRHVFHACFQGMTSNEKYAQAQGAAFTVLQADELIMKALFGEIAMTCLVTMVVLLGAVKAKSKSPLVPFLVGCTVIINILVG